jgi:ADP-ribosylglycohydrolase
MKRMVLMSVDKRNGLIGAIAGDIVGSIYEWNNWKSKYFELFDAYGFFTDDSVLSLCLAESILTGTDYALLAKEFYTFYPDAGFGGAFKRWCESESMEPYNSWGNGAAMRVSPIAHVAKSLDEAMELSEKYTSITHNHPEGIKAAAATVSAAYLALHKESKETIKNYVIDNFTYDITSKTLDDIRPTYQFDVSSAGTMPVALLSFFEATGYEDSIRNAVSIGGDTDTICAITGTIAGCYYGVPNHIAAKAESYLDDRLTKILKNFEDKYIGRAI